MGSSNPNPLGPCLGVLGPYVGMSNEVDLNMVDTATGVDQQRLVDVVAELQTPADYLGSR